MHKLWVFMGRKLAVLQSWVTLSHSGHSSEQWKFLKNSTLAHELRDSCDLSAQLPRTWRDIDWYHQLLEHKLLCAIGSLFSSDIDHFAKIPGFQVPDEYIKSRRELKLDDRCAGGRNTPNCTIGQNRLWGDFLPVTCWGNRYLGRSWNECRDEDVYIAQERIIYESKQQATMESPWQLDSNALYIYYVMDWRKFTMTIFTEPKLCLHDRYCTQRSQFLSDHITVLSIVRHCFGCGLAWNGSDGLDVGLSNKVQRRGHGHLPKRL